MFMEMGVNLNFWLLCLLTAWLVWLQLLANRLTRILKESRRESAKCSEQSVCKRAVHLFFIMSHLS